MGIVFGTWRNGLFNSHEPHDGLESWDCLAYAKQSLKARSYCSRDIFRNANRLADGIYERGHSEDFLIFVSSELENQYIDLYAYSDRARWSKASENHSLYRVDFEPYARLTLGPRLGVRMESF